MWPAPIELIPHRSPMLLVEEIVERGEERLVCRGVLPGWPGSEDTEGTAKLPRPSGASPFLALEMAAQTAAVLAALEGRAGSGSEAPASGYLAAIQDARFLVKEIPGGQPLLAAVRRTAHMPPLTKYSITVTLEEGSVELIRATLSTFQRNTPRRNR